jgi:GTP pyrophosphokinase
VNQKLEPLSYQLRNGDQPKFRSLPSSAPLIEWFNYVTTPPPKAKSKIKDFLREGQRASK